MKILIVADTHSKTSRVIKWLGDKKEDIDLVIHLGDYDIDGDEIENKTGIETRSVAGNNDYRSSSRPGLIKLDLMGHRLLATHGHSYGVPSRFQRLYLLAEQEGADIVLFGHSHDFVFAKEGGIYFINPGSPSFPRGDGRKSMAVLTLEEGKDPTLERIIFD